MKAWRERRKAFAKEKLFAGVNLERNRPQMAPMHADFYEKSLINAGALSF
jgi:hypothetical protein